MGFIKAIKRFDFEFNVELSTYAVQYMIGEIKKFLRDDGILHVSRQLKENAGKIAIAKEEWKKKNHSEPTMKELMEVTGLSSEEIVAALEASADVESIYEPIGNQGEGTQMVLADQLMDTRKTEGELIDRITVSQMLESLGEKERQLIRLRYMEGKTQAECAKVFGINQVAVSRLEKKILLFLRRQF